jgi:hypothetical protein
LKNWVIIQGVFFAALGVLLIYLTLSKVPFEDVLVVIKTGNFLVLIPVFLVSILVILIRVWRWKLLFNENKTAINNISLFNSLNIGYLVNFAVPRLGEITRAFILKKSDSLPVNRSISTIVFERLVDIFALLFLLISAFVLEFIFGGGLLSHFTKGINFRTKLLLISSGIVILVLSVYLLYRFRNKFGHWFSELMENFLQLFKMQNKFQFFLSTALIWLGFYLMTYLWIFMFPSSSQLNIYQCFQVMILGVIARTLPIQGGSAGAYHYVVSSAFLLLGTDQTTSSALAIVIHGFQTILTLLIGIISYIWFLYFNPKK